MTNPKLKYSITLAVLFISILTWLCCAPSPKYRIHQKPQMRWKVEENIVLESVVGMASFYGDEFAGNPTASGVIFDPDANTAAHKTYPFGTKVLVTNLKNNRSVVVIINDRGPFISGRIIDLSYGAAERIGMVKDGVSRVRLDVIEWGDK